MLLSSLYFLDVYGFFYFELLTNNKIAESR